MSSTVILSVVVTANILSDLSRRRRGYVSPPTSSRCSPFSLRGQHRTAPYGDHPEPADPRVLRRPSQLMALGSAGIWTTVIVVARPDGPEEAPRSPCPNGTLIARVDSEPAPDVEPGDQLQRPRPVPPEFRRPRPLRRGTSTCSPVLVEQGCLSTIHRTER